VGASISRNPKGLHGLYRKYIYMGKNEKKETAKVEREGDEKKKK
jgi:hypothetical protein